MQDLAGGFSIEDLRARVAAAALRVDRQGEDGDHRFNPGHPRLEPGRPLRDAAVLVAVVDRRDEPGVILTKRAETLRDHTGQVAFPGGRIDPGDASAEQAALREAEEEIGLAPSAVDIVGRLPDYISGSGYRIAPVIGTIAPGYTLTINRSEVDAAFEVPMRFLMDPANHTVGRRDWQGRSWMFYDMPYGNYRIWGVTAGIIRTIYERLYA